MSGFAGLWDYVGAQENGQSHYSFWRKTVNAVTTSGVWFDLSMSPGNPSPQYYAATPLVAQQFKRSTDGGINHGPDAPSGKTKHLKRFLMMASSATGAPMPYVLCDYLLYYPFIAQDTNDEQSLTNSVALPRYTDGKGVQMMVVSVAPNSGAGPTFTVSYTNSDGAAGRTTVASVVNSATANGALLASQNVSSGYLCFVPLQGGDLGVRSVESLTITSGADVGLMALVLVKPIATGCLFEQTAPSEIECASHISQLPKIENDAFLSLLTYPQGSLSGIAYHGEIETVWN